MNHSLRYLGNGLSTVYQLELGVNMDGTTSSVATGVTNTTTGAVSTTSVNTLSLRNSYVGVKGGFCTVLFDIKGTFCKEGKGMRSLLMRRDAVFRNIKRQVEARRVPEDFFETARVECRALEMTFRIYGGFPPSTSMKAFRKYLKGEI